MEQFVTPTGPHDAAYVLPILIYDGDCGFCYYWVRYWRYLTGDKVVYTTYQEVAIDYPEIPLESFQTAVQYIAPDGTVASAAKASFLTLSNAEGKGYWLTLYKYFPGFAWVTEKAYRLISTHRSFFYVLSVMLYGRHLAPPRYDRITWIFLRLFGLIYFAAFVSFSVQALGLIGHQGILPVSQLVTESKNQLGDLCYMLFPMVFWINSSDWMIQAVCWLGAGVSLLLVLNILPRVSLVILYVLYLSLAAAGQVFMSFQWDAFLLETGILALFLFQTRTLGIALLRWLLFRFVFFAGVVKLMSGDIAWRDGTALFYHFYTQPLPTPLAWYANYIPHEWLIRLTHMAVMVELTVPFLFFFPRHIRFIAGLAVLTMQTAILLTGNYNFFNIQTIVLCLVLFDDAALKTIMPNFCWQRIPGVPQKKITDFVIKSLVYMAAACLVSLSILQIYFSVGGQAPRPVMQSVGLLGPFRLANMYGPFAIMTKQRMEIIIEGSEDTVDWKEYGFKYKPGAIDKPLSWNIPHQPRLDWQMWFAALSSPQQNPWLPIFMQRILEGSQPVLELLEENPFPNKPPFFIRAQFYEYHFTTPDERKKSHNVWTRTLVGTYIQSAYLPP